MLAHAHTDLTALFAFLTFATQGQAFTTPCIYQQYKCGYNLVATQGSSYATHIIDPTLSTQELC